MLTTREALMFPSHLPHTLHGKGRWNKREAKSTVHVLGEKPTRKATHSGDLDSGS